MASMCKPLSQAFFPENTLSRAPTKNNAALEIAAAMMTPLLAPIMSGRLAPMAKAIKEDKEAAT
jgi:hypothetical protein